jgi:hypothetical protein
MDGFGPGTVDTPKPGPFAVARPGSLSGFKKRAPASASPFGMNTNVILSLGFGLVILLLVQFLRMRQK